MVDPGGTDQDTAGLARAEWHRVIPSAALPPRGIKECVVAGNAVVVVRTEDGVPAACQALCPHRQARLARGSIYMGCIDCPDHHYLYDLRTGQNRYPRDVFPADKAAGLAALRLYPVREEGGSIWIKAAPDTTPYRSICNTAY